ncbi:MAG: O-succinylhomoserine sulfhydrylase [Alphaproteobacteria bacterium]|nr:O-succinylhomoserine sulfhydrylase [Alphaproteobacteria bacterium]
MTDDSKGQAKFWRPQTRLVRGGTSRTGFRETSEAIIATSGYVYQSAEEAEARFKGENQGFTYSRFENPTVDMFERRMALLEGKPLARATASGMAAVTAALMCQLRAGDHVVASKALFGSCRYIVEDLLPRYGIPSTLVDGRDTDAFRKAMRPATRAVFLESPANPTLDIVDIAAVAAIAHEAGARLVVDNVFATPLLQHPGELGADIVVYSATKHIDGQGRCLGGVILGDEAFVLEELKPFLRNTGPTLSPFNAWVLLKALETLPLRVDAHCRSAATVADFLAEHESVTRVLYPGRRDHPQHDLAMAQMSAGGSVVTFEVKGGKAGAFRLLNGLGLIDISNNLGDAKSLITHPATTTHQRLSPEARAELGISDAMVRLSVGLEDVEDLKDDLAQALRRLG